MVINSSQDSQQEIAFCIYVKNKLDGIVSSVYCAGFGCFKRAGWAAESAVSISFDSSFQIHRQNDGERAAFADFTLHFNFALVLLNDVVTSK